MWQLWGNLWWILYCCPWPAETSWEQMLFSHLYPKLWWPNMTFRNEAYRGLLLSPRGLCDRKSMMLSMATPNQAMSLLPVLNVGIPSPTTTHQVAQQLPWLVNFKVVLAPRASGCKFPFESKQYEDTILPGTLLEDLQEGDNPMEQEVDNQVLFLLPFSPSSPLPII